MKYIDWDPKKNELLIQERGISFDTVAVHIKERNILDVIDHPNKTRYSHQRIYVLEVEHYVYAVPFVEDEEKIFLKTILPSRKLTKRYRNK